jgi:hypothetical protein
MRPAKIWGGGMVGLIGGFVVVPLLLRILVPGDGTRVTADTAVLVLALATIPLITGAVIGAYLAERLTRPGPARQVGSLSEPGLTEGSPPGAGAAFGEWTGMALLLGDVAVDDEAVWELVGLVEQPLRHKLETALRLRSSVVSVTPDDRKAILQALENAPDSLRGVQELLLTNEQWRQSHAVLERVTGRSSTLGPRAGASAEVQASCVAASSHKVASSECDEASDRRPAA